MGYNIHPQTFVSSSANGGGGGGGRERRWAFTAGCTACHCASEKQHINYSISEQNSPDMGIENRNGMNETFTWFKALKG